MAPALSGNGSMAGPEAVQPAILNPFQSCSGRVGPGAVMIALLCVVIEVLPSKVFGHPSIGVCFTSRRASIQIEPQGLMHHPIFIIFCVDQSRHNRHWRYR
jgi:hypothetical protein